MNKRIVITVVAVFCLLLIGSLVLTVTGNDGIVAGASSGASSAQQATLDEDIYIVKEYDGKVAVFRQGENTPLNTTTQMVVDLPDRDRKTLKEGVQVTGKEKLRKLMEDYCS